MTQRSWSQINNKAAHYGTNGGRATAKKNRVYVYVDGLPHTYEQIAERIQLSKTTAQKRVAIARNLGRPITWSDLQ